MEREVDMGIGMKSAKHPSKSKLWKILSTVTGIPLILTVIIIGFAFGLVINSFLYDFEHRADDPQGYQMRQNLDDIRLALHMHDAQQAHLTGLSLKPLVGRYLQELPKDPWGNDYLFDSSVGLILSFGGSKSVDGYFFNSTACQYYKPNLSIQRVQYEGIWGKPKAGARIICTMNKPFAVTNHKNIEHSLQLLTDLSQQGDRIGTKGKPVSFSEMNKRGTVPPKWRVGSSNTEDVDFKTYEANVDSKKGILCLYNDVDTKGDEVQEIAPTMALNFDLRIKPTVFGGEYGFIERSIPGGPLTSSIYGAGVMKYYRAPIPVPLYNDENRGVKIEKF